MRRIGRACGFALGAALLFCWDSAAAQEQSPAQKRILIERGEKVTGARLALARTVIESYQDCEVISEGNEIKALKINGKLYQDFTLIIRDAKKTIVVVTADGLYNFDY